MHAITTVAAAFWRDASVSHAAISAAPIQPQRAGGLTIVARTVSPNVRTSSAVNHVSRPA